MRYDWFSVLMHNEQSLPLCFRPIRTMTHTDGIAGEKTSGLDSGLAVFQVHCDLLETCEATAIGFIMKKRNSNGAPAGVEKDTSPRKRLPAGREPPDSHTTMSVHFDSIVVALYRYDRERMVTKYIPGAWRGRDSESAPCTLLPHFKLHTFPRASVRVTRYASSG